MRQVCLVEGCDQRAWYRVDAQWTIADFDACYVCYDHLGTMYRWFARRLVEGIVPQVWTTTLDIEESGS